MCECENAECVKRIVVEALASLSLSSKGMPVAEGVGWG